MCNCCGFPNPTNHIDWMECMEAWRGEAQRLAPENAKLSKQVFIQAQLLDVCLAAFQEIRQDLAVHLYTTADCCADRMIRSVGNHASANAPQ